MPDAFSELYDLIWTAIVEDEEVAKFVKPQDSYKSIKGKDREPREDFSVLPGRPRLDLLPVTDGLVHEDSGTDSLTMLFDLIISSGNICLDLELNPIRVAIYKALVAMRAVANDWELQDDFFRVDSVTFGSVTMRVSSVGEDLLAPPQPRGWTSVVQITVTLSMGE